MWTIQPMVPKLMNQISPAPRKNKRAARIRPWINCPSPGKTKLQSAAITFPAVPRPVLITRVSSYEPEARASDSGSVQVPGFSSQRKFSNRILLILAVASPLLGPPAAAIISYTLIAWSHRLEDSNKRAAANPAL